MAEILRPLAAADPPPDHEPRPLAVGAAQLGKLLGLGLRTIRGMDAAGKLPTPIRLGGSVRWRVAEIEAWLSLGAPDRETWAAIRAARK